MRNKWTLALLALGLLLAACGGGTGGRDTSDVTVSLVDPAGALVGAVYRVGSGEWRELRFADGQATFQASGVYEVVARCRGEPDRVYHTKATPTQMDRVVIPCSTVDAPQVQVTLTAQLPPTIGQRPVEDGSTSLTAELDVRFFPLLGWALIPEGGAVQSRRAQARPYLPVGLQDVVLTVANTGVTGTGLIHCLAPMGWKRVQLDIRGSQSYTVGEEGWQPFHATPSLSVSSRNNPGVPSIYVAYFREGMRSLGRVGFSDGTLACQYGTLPPREGGVYLGIAVGYVFSESGTGWQKFAVLKDIGGQDWTVEMPPPWPEGGLTVSGATLTLNYPGALSYALQANGFLRDRETQAEIPLFAILFPEGGAVVYTPPDAGEELGYGVAPSDTYSVEALAFTRNNNNSLPSILFAPGAMPDEATLRGLDLAVARLFVGQGD